MLVYTIQFLHVKGRPSTIIDKISWNIEEQVLAYTQTKYKSNIYCQFSNSLPPSSTVQCWFEFCELNQTIGECSCPRLRCRQHCFGGGRGQRIIITHSFDNFVNDCQRLSAIVWVFGINVWDVINGILTCQINTMNTWNPYVVVVCHRQYRVAW